MSRNDNRDTDDTITQGMQAHWDGGAIGGGGSYIDDEGRAVVILSIGHPDNTSDRSHFHEGDTFELGQALWEVTEIIDAGTSAWAAEITRLR